MINFIKKWLKRDRKIIGMHFNSSTLDLPGYEQPSIEDLKLAVVLFEKRVKDYANYQGISLKKRNGDKKSLFELINELKNINPLRSFDSENHKWFSHIDELHELRNFRNKIIHIDYTGLPDVAELYDRYSAANQLLLPFRLNGGCTKASFKPIKWHGETLEIVINEHKYNLDYSDIENLSVQLHPASRGAVYCKHGKQVVVKTVDYEHEQLCVFIEDCPSFQLTEDEAAILDDLLLSLITEKEYRQQTTHKLPTALYTNQ